MAKNLTPSPFAPKKEQPVFPVNGVECASTKCGLYKHKEDLSLFLFTKGTSVAGVFTQSQTASAPVLLCRENLKHQKASALVINSGNSFAMTGKNGIKAVEEIVSSVAKQLNILENEVFICSTGVIGHLPDYTKIINALPTLNAGLCASNINNTAKAIMTTDTFPKTYSTKFTINGKEVTISGVAKGSGMIEPNMATMLAFIFTDAMIPSITLQNIVSKHVETTFNSITVDSDTSTSDTLLAFATNHVDIKIEENLEAFSTQLYSAMESLAKQIIMDGEGITKLITVNVDGAKSYISARTIAKSVANSPLVKTAITGNDPNWGRIAMAIGKTTEEINLQKLSIAIGKHIIYNNEELVPTYKEEEVYYYLRGAFVEINIGVGVGSCSATVWGCNLTQAYIDINADYRS